MRVVRPHLFRIGCALLMLAAVSILSGCAGASFLNDLEGVLPTVGLAIPGIVALVASLSGDPALAGVAGVIQPILARVQQNLTAANSLVHQYKQDGSETTLEQIEALVPQIQQDLDSLPAVDGLPPDVAAKIKAITDVVVPELNALLSSLPVFKPSTAGQTMTVTKPIPAAQFKSNVQAVIPTNQ